jgi:hypothetical protein
MIYIQKYNPQDFTNSIDNRISLRTNININDTRSVNLTQPLNLFKKQSIDNIKFITDILPINDSLRRYRNEDVSGSYIEYCNMINFNKFEDSLYRIKTPNIVSFQSTKKFEVRHKIKYILNPGNDDMFITNDTSFEFEGFTSNGQTIKVQYAASGEVVTEIVADKYFGNFKINFDLDEGIHELLFISKDAGKPTKYFNINIKVDLSVQSSMTDFLEVLDTNMITKSEMNTTKLVGSIEPYGNITKIEITDNSHIVNINTSNLILNKTNWTYEVLLDGLEGLDDGQITAHVTVQDRIGNTIIVSNNIELFKFAFSPIVMFI